MSKWHKSINITKGKELCDDKKNFLTDGLYKPKNIHQLIYNIRKFFRNIKYFIQRGKYGFSISDLINFDMYLSEMFYGALTDFANISTGCPYSYEELYGEEKCFEKWQSEIKQIAKVARELAKDSYNYVDENDTRPFKQKYEEAELKKKALKQTFFGWLDENWENLWE